MENEDTIIVDVVDTNNQIKVSEEVVKQSPLEEKDANKVFIKDIEDLKRSSKKVYTATINSLVTTIVNELKRSQERLKEIKKSYQ